MTVIEMVLFCELTCGRLGRLCLSPFKLLAGTYCDRCWLTLYHAVSLRLLPFTPEHAYDSILTEAS